MGRTKPQRSAPLAVGSFAIVIMVTSVLALSDAWAASRFGNWPIIGGGVETAQKGPTLRAQLSAVRSAAPERANVGYIGEYAETMGELDPQLPIAFFADEPPLLTYPLLGPDLDRDLVVLPASTRLAGALSAKRDGVRYLYVALTSRLADGLPAQGARLVGPVFSGFVFDLSPPPISYQSALPQRDEVSATIPGASTGSQVTVESVFQGVSPALTDGCLGDGVGSDAAAWAGQAPYVLTAAACEFADDSTPDQLSTTIINELYATGYALTYSNETGLTAVFEKEIDGTVEAVVIVRLWNRLAIVDVTTVPNKHSALVDIAVNVTERFMAIG